MLKTDWNKLSRRYPRHTLVRDPATYADVFAAIDEAAGRAAAVEPSADEFEIVGNVPHDATEQGDFLLWVWRVPAVASRYGRRLRSAVGRSRAPWKTPRTMIARSETL